MTNQPLPVNSAAQLANFVGDTPNDLPITELHKPSSSIPSVSDFYTSAPQKLSGEKLKKVISELESALKCIPSDEYKTWVDVGHPLYKLGDDGYKLWIAWSKKSHFFNQADADHKWHNHLTQPQTSYPTIFTMAAGYGWVNPWKKKPISNAITKSINQNLPKEEPDFAWIDGFTLTEQEVNGIADPKWLYPDLIIQGHLIAIPAPPNGGKTTVFFKIACDLAESGLNVIYVNADISASDAKSMVLDAHKNGVKLLLPEMKAGLSMNDVVDRFKEMNNKNSDYSEYVVIFDTYKKMTDVISKSQSKDVLQVLRGLTAKGMTIILLSHTNKYKDAEDNHIFEGTGDLRADVDELIYLVPQKHPDGSMTVSTRPDKVRGDFSPITFEISKDRQVTRSSEYVDVSAAVEFENAIEHDKEIIDIVIQKLNSATNVKRADLIDLVKSSTDAGRDKVIRVLDRWDGHQWTSTKDNANRNTITYRIKSVTPPPKPPQHLLESAGGLGNQ